MDNLLIYLVQSYNEEALQELIKKYKKIIPAWTKEILCNLEYYKEFDIQILYNDLDMIVYKTIETYDSSKGIFYSYLRGAVHNVIMNHIRYNHRANAYSISLNSEVDDNLFLIDTISNEDNLSKIIERYNILEEVEDILIKINKMKNDEKEIVYMKMQGYTNDEIIYMMKTNIRKVNYITRKTKKL